MKRTSVAAMAMPAIAPVLRCCAVAGEPVAAAVVAVRTVPVAAVEEEGEGEDVG